MADTALCIGINRYGSGMDLAGCVNDANDWAAELSRREFQTTVLLDAAAVKDEITTAMRTVLHSARRTDSVVITFSGHGTWVPDGDGDEADRRDEALCPADVMATGEVITDDELHDIFSERNPGTRVVFISDSCHSGTVSRFAGPLPGAPVHMRDSPEGAQLGPSRTVRFLPPAAFLDPDDAQRARALPMFPPAPTVRHPNLLMSGCADPEYSYDAYFNGRPNGAFTYVALQALHALTGADLRNGPTYREWWTGIRHHLPSVDYPQTPMLYGTSAQKDWRALA